MDLTSRKTALTAQNLLPVQRKPDTGITISEIYLDGKLKKAECIDEDEKSYGIFMHSLSLSSYAEVIKVNGSNMGASGDDVERAILRYTTSKGFDNKLIHSIAPEVEDLCFDCKDNLDLSAHMINEKVRIVSKGTPNELLKRCSYILMDSKFVKVTRRICKEVNAVLNDMIGRCLSVYALAIKDISRSSQAAYKGCRYVDDMTLVALIGMGKAR